ncbi:cysteine hydrolase family protein [Paracoccus sp. ME4]|uniref:cysteine hydrolase family protein n=1 Tax=Paracoccus sp. ME4 TaxID=3138066 RepID=UPI00398AEF36
MLAIGQAAASGNRGSRNAARVIAFARERGDLVVNIRHEAPDAPFFVPGSEGTNINEAVQPRPDEEIITKNFPNSFRETGLKDLLDQHDVDEVIIVGAMSHMCIDAGVRAASDLGYATVTIHDACATMDLTFGETTVPAAQVHAAIMAGLEMFYGEVITTDDFMSR